jgi:signal transduction histidine kinase/ActR/RegA family two-component response regulator
VQENGSRTDTDLVDALPIGVFVCEPQRGHLIRYNPGAAQLWGREPPLRADSSRFDGAFRLYTPEGTPLPHDRTPIAEVLRTARPVGDTDIVVERPDGSRITVVLTASPLNGPGGSLAGAVGVFREVSERRRGEERERLLLQASTVLGSTLDHQAILRQLVRLALPRYADWCLLEVVEDDGSVGAVAGAHVHPDREGLVIELAGRAGALGDSVAGVLRTGESFLLSMVPRGFTGSVARSARQLELLTALGPESLIAAPLKARGKVMGFIAFVFAGSGRRYQPADLPLVEGVARRAALAIDNARLYRDSQQANRLKDEFLATLSHELRTPLNAVLGWTQLLLTRQLRGDEIGRALQTIRRNAEAQARLIGDILDVSRIITGKLRLNIGPTDLRAVIDAAVEGVRPAAEAKGLALTVDSAGSPRAMLADPDRLQQVIWNLLSNAVKFTPPGGHVTLEVDAEGGTTHVRVSDTGAGIPPRFLGSLFERFRQADGSTTRAYGGLGLGLAIVRHLVELHGGSVRGESEGEGRGATFTVTLPVTQPFRRLVRNPSLFPPPSVVVQVEITNLDGLEALVVDDDQDSRQLTRAVLEGLGARVREAASVPDAVSALRSDWPEVLLADIGMPGEDGYSLIGWVRRLEPEAGRRLPALALTAYAREADRDRALSAGFDAYLAKPAAPAEVARAVARITGRVPAGGREEQDAG